MAVVPAAVRRTISLHDTRTGQVRAVEPREPGRIGIHACGPTVYGRIHVGNARPFVVFALLARFLAHEGYEVTLVENITDVNDKIYDAARAAGVPSAELAREMADHYIADTDRLAHRVLGDGGAAPGIGVRRPRRRFGPRVSTSRERGRADARCARDAARPPLGAQRDGAARRGEDGEVRGQHRLASRGARRVR